jgi:hypothetical protein
MRRRKFRFANCEKALSYISFLCSQGISFEVFCHVNYIDVCTVFALRPGDFPDPKNLLQDPRD